MKKSFVRILCLAAVLVFALMSVSYAANYGYFYVKTGNGKTLNVRSSPLKAGNSNIIARINYRSYVLVYQYNDNGTWAYIEVTNPTGSGTIKGWVQASFLVSYDPGPYNGGSGSSSTTSDITFDQINNAAKAMTVLTNSYQTVIQTKNPANYVHLRWFPSTSAVYSGAYLCGTAIEVLAESNTWAQVRVLADGKVGFILKSCVTPLAY